MITVKETTKQPPLCRGMQVKLKGKPGWYTLRSECANQTVPSWWAIHPKGWVAPVRVEDVKSTREATPPPAPRQRSRRT